MRWRATMTVGLALSLAGALAPGPSARITGLGLGGNTTGFDSTSPKSVSGFCGGARRLLAGTGQTGFPFGQVVLDDVRPNPGLTSVFVQAVEDENGFADDWILAAGAICADPPPGLERVTATSPFNSANKSVTASCPAGKQALSAQGEINAGSGQVVMDDVRPNPGLTGVTVQGVEDETGQAGSWSIVAHAICANPVPGVERVVVTSALNSADKSVALPCPQYKQLVGAGYDTNAGNGQVSVNNVATVLDLENVNIAAFEDENGQAGPWSLTGYAVCAPTSQRVSVTSPLDSESKSEFMFCTSGQVLLGVGYDINGGSGEVGIQSTTPDALFGEPVSRASAFAAEDQDGKAGPWSLTIHGICVTAPGGFLTTTVSDTNSNTSKGADATCPAGREAIGGGGSVGGSGEVVMDTYRPISFLTGVTGFRVTGTEDQDGFAGNWAVTAYAICVTLPDGYEHVTALGAFNSSNKTTTVNCPAGKIVASAGGRIDSGAGQVLLDDVRPNPALSSVTVQGVEDQDGNTNSWGLDAHAVCVTAP